MRGDRERLEDMLEMCRNLREHIDSPDALATDPVLLAASQRWIEILGEAAAGLSTEFRAAHPEVPWRGAIGMRNILAHGYFELDLAILRAVLERDAPVLERDITAILQELE